MPTGVYKRTKKNKGCGRPRVNVEPNTIVKILVPKSRVKEFTSLVLPIANQFQRANKLPKSNA